MSDKIIIFPEIENLMEDISRIRIEITTLLGERDELVLVICKNIENKYMLVLGNLEYKVYKAECGYLRVKRKMELIQAKVNRGEKVDIEKIETLLDEEFREYEQQMEAQMGKINDALKWSEGKELSAADTMEVKRLYRKIVKVLHPDLNPEITREERELFFNAVAAYEAGDLVTLRIIVETISEGVDFNLEEAPLCQLVKEKERLEELLDNLRASIDKVKTEYPYILKDILEDEEAVAMRKEDLKRLFEQYREATRLYQDRIKEMLR